jgi:hypothetical protein
MEVMTLDPTSGRSVVVGLRLTEGDLARADELAARLGCRRSDVLRRGLALQVDDAEFAAAVAVRLLDVDTVEVSQ